MPDDLKISRLAVRLDAALADTDAAMWVQVAREGNFKGYAGGASPFRFTRADLTAMVRNVQSHPSFERGPTGDPVGLVIPWDYNHASEQDPTLGDLPVSGAPAQAWTLDLEIRQGSHGFFELWALTQFLEPARTYVRSSMYQWASVAVTFNAINPVSGEDQGALITSIALTNTPFIEGMQKLVASKQMFPQHEGVSIPSVVGKTTEVEQAASVAARKLEDQTMGENTKVLASLLDVRETDEAVNGAVKETVELRKALVSVLDVTAGCTDEVLLKAAKNSMDAREQLTKLFTAMQLDGGSDAIERVAELMTSAAQLEEIMPELRNLRAAKAESDEAIAAADVDQAMASHNVPDAAREALLLFRTADADKFAAKFPKVESAKPDEQPPVAAHLTRDAAVDGNGAPITDGNVEAVPDGAIDLATFDGANKTARARTYLALNHKGWSDMTNENQFLLAVSFKRQKHVIDTTNTPAA